MELLQFLKENNYKEALNILIKDYDYAVTVSNVSKLISEQSEVSFSDKKELVAKFLSIALVIEQTAEKLDLSSSKIKVLTRVNSGESVEAVIEYLDSINENETFYIKLEPTIVDNDTAWFDLYVRHRMMPYPSAKEVFSTLDDYINKMNFTSSEPVKFKL